MKIDSLWDGLENLKDTLNILYETADMAGFAFQQGFKEEKIGPVITGIGNGIHQVEQEVQVLIEDAIAIKDALNHL